MSVQVGQQFGSYEITALLGQGGMGEVYRARDSNLKRDVAVKVLPESFSRDAERVSRFRREAEVLASLNHPHIAAIYDMAHFEGTPLLVMELVEGETLADRIARGPLSFDEALELGKQIAEALETAHEKGIVHRDLKPANIKILRNGNVKVLDFGLAKVLDDEAKSLSSSNSPTLLTAPVGMILGTAAYMSPEQARGKRVDKRADIWAFGVVLYEMLTGLPLFKGESTSDTLSAVLTKEPEWDRVPEKVRILLSSCLEKDPARRLRDIGDAWRLLADHAPPVASRSKSLWIGVAVLAIVSAISVAALWRSTERVMRSSMRVAVDLGPDVSLSGLGADVILSPDGTRIAFIGRSSRDTPQLFMRRLDEPAPHELAGTAGAYGHFFSPDGKWVGFFAFGKLKKVSIDGSDPITLCDAPAGRGATWSEDGQIFAALDSQGGISQIPAEGGKPTTVTDLETGENSHRWPQALPGGKAVLYLTNSVYGNFEKATIAAVTLADRRKKVVLQNVGMHPKYLPTGQLTFVTNGALFAVPFDLGRLEAVGTPTRVLDDVLSNTNMGFAQLDVARNGAVAYRTGRIEALKTVQWLDAAGKTEPLVAEPALYQFPRFSPDGNRLAIVVVDGPNSVIWIHDWQRGSKTRLTPGNDVNTFPVWTPDGQFLVFRSTGGMSWSRADGADKPQQLTQTKTVQSPMAFTPDGTRLVFFEFRPGAAAEIRTVKIDRDANQLRAGDSELFLQTPSTNALPSLSQDGRWLAYSSGESGVYEVYVQAFPNKGTKWLISNSGGTMPVWSRNGRELFYRTEDHRIMVASYTVRGDAFFADKPRLWTPTRLAEIGFTPNMDLAPDGKRFAAVMSVGTGQSPQQGRNYVMLVLNFFDEIRRVRGNP